MPAADPSKVRYLKEFYSTAEVRQFWKDLGDTGSDFATNPIQINSHTQDGESSGGIVVASAADRDIWFKAAEQAFLELKAEDDGEEKPGIPAEELSRGTDWSQKMVRV